MCAGFGGGGGGTGLAGAGLGAAFGGGAGLAGAAFGGGAGWAGAAFGPGPYCGFGFWAGPCDGGGAPSATTALTAAIAAMVTFFMNTS